MRRTITSAQITAMLKHKYSDFHRALYANVWFPLVYLDEWLVGNLFCAFVRNYLNKKETDSTLSVIQDWPSQSPDSNAIDLVWEEMDQQVQKQNPTK